MAEVYAIGGLGQDGILGTVERYAPELGAWDLVTPMPTARYVHAAAVLRGSIYVVRPILQRSPPPVSAPLVAPVPVAPEYIAGLG